MNPLNYFISFLLILIACLSADSQKQSTHPIPPDIKRIVFLGNSITYAGEYVTDVEAYLRAHHPAVKAEFINVGLPSETVSGLSEEGHADGKFPRPDLHERLTRVLKKTKPDWVFACYGMNDGIYLSLDEERFRKFREGITWLHDELEKAGVKKIIHLTPPVFDEQKGGHAGYAHVLDTYSGWLRQQQQEKKWIVVDIHSAMNDYLKSQRYADPTFALASDGVHPGSMGHWLIAREILRYLDQPTSAANILAALENVPDGKSILAWVAQRQQFMKDAWLTATGHQRPGMETGMPLRQAKKRARQIEKELSALQK